MTTDEQLVVGEIDLVDNTDARALPMLDTSADLVVTSPPYWRKRDYGMEGQIGQEPTVEGYVEAIIDCLTEWRRVLRPTGSVFLNIGDTYHRQSLAGVPGLVEQAAVKAGWKIRNRVVWAKAGGHPEPSQRRLANRHEYVIHLVPSSAYYYDLFGFADGGPNPGDVWQMALERDMSAHLAPFPAELARRAIALGCPEQVCVTCSAPRQRVVGRSTILNADRPQAVRAMQLATAAGLTPEHIAAVQSVGISDVGKATKFQNGTGRNSDTVKALAAEAKAALGGYFREFTMAPRTHEGWTDCGHDDYIRGVVLDPFAGTGTTVRVAEAMGRRGVGFDLACGQPPSNAAVNPVHRAGP